MYTVHIIYVSTYVRVFNYIYKNVHCMYNIVCNVHFCSLHRDDVYNPQPKSTSNHE